MATALETARHEVARLVETESLGRQQSLDALADKLQSGVNAAFGQAGDTGQQIKDVLHGTWLGHSVHAAMTDLPIGAFVTTAILDLFNQRRAADAALTVGVVSTLPVAATGLTDWSETYGKARRVGLVHALLNGVGLVFFVLSLRARRRNARTAGIGLSTLGLACSTVAAWLGGELIHRLGVYVTRYAFTPDVEEFQVAATLNDLPEGRLKQAEVTLNGEKVPLVLLRRGNEVLALNNICSHWGGPLAEGKLDGDCVQCPWHGSTFNMRDGSIARGPASVPQLSYETRVRDGKVEVRQARA